MGAGRRPLSVLVAVMAVLAPLAPAGATTDTTVRWTSFSESNGCGVSRTSTPGVAAEGFLADSEPVHGPFGTYFGRSIGAVRDRLVWWTVPMSGGKQVLVHSLAYSAFQQVSSNLAAEQAAGRFYSIDDVGAFTPRTVAGTNRVSRHGLGLAIDINPARNPYTTDPDAMRTDMPAWFVDAWREAGFCWGGDWIGVKDPMHFSWMGPAPGTDGLEPLTPKGIETAFRFGGAYDTVFGARVADRPVAVADATGNGAVDVIRVREHPDGSVIDAAQARGGFGGCSITRWFVPGSVSEADRVLFADVDSDSRQDLIALAVGDTITATVGTYAQTFADLVGLETAVPPSASSLAAGDFDGDHVADLFGVVEDELVVWAGPGWTAEIHRAALGVEPPALLAVGDRDGDGDVEVFAGDADASQVRVLEWTGSAWSHTETADLTPSAALVMAAADEDGDGRSDLAVLSSTGRLTLAVGNSATGRAVDGWWNDPGFECPDVVIPVVWNGTFFDDDDSVFEGDIEAIAAEGITKGCNPPFNDMFCPESGLTRGQMAAFLVRALGLPEASADRFTDDDGHLFENDIDRLAQAGITKGCNPPANDRFCPDDPVTRGQMAAFLVRALGLPAAPPAGFVDTAGSVFAQDIDRLARAGITKGCNPPVNDRFCPDDGVTRGQMAAFLNRSR